MFFAFARRVALGAVVACAVACSENAASNASSDGGTTGDAGAAVTFDVAGVLTTTPRQSVDVGLHVAGPDGVVSLRLDGDYADGSLSAGEIATVGGHATFTLHAPAVPATFSLRAHANSGPDARLDVSVSAAGFATLRVIPQYDGTRPAPGVTASVFVKSTCADLANALAAGRFQDGAPATDGVIASPITIGSVPAGSHVAVSVRIKLYAAGCVDLDALAADSTRDVNVPILDRPMALGAIDLATTLTFEPDATQLSGWTTMLDAAIARAADGFVPEATGEAGVLLDAMYAVVPPASQASFDAARTTGTWDSRTATWLGQHTPTMRDHAITWMTAAKPDTLGSLTASILPSQSLGYATLSLASFVGLDTATIGMSAGSTFAFTADADDVLHLSGTLHLWSTALVCETANGRARQAVSGSTDVPSALALLADCDGLATSLLGGGTSYPGCGATCTASLCQQALGVMWKKAHDASSTANDDATIDVTASAAATIADDATPATFSGAWVGQIASSLSSYAHFAIQGAAQGSQTNLPH
jgi:hypothetical protein